MTAHYDISLASLESNLNQANLEKLTPWLIDILSPLELKHGHLERWQQALNTLPDVNVNESSIDQDALLVNGDINKQQHSNLLSSLQNLKPWRKGPFSFFDINIDTEWQSNIKWNRIQQAIDNKFINLEDKSILDVGCGNGYYAYRMLANSAKYILGVDPSIHYCMQFKAFNHYYQTNQIDVLPITLEHFFDARVFSEKQLNQYQNSFTGFDCVFSMGVLYHRKSPFEHLNQLKNLLRKNGQLILETLVLDNLDPHQVLVPSHSYAGMSNVWFIPSAKALENWLSKIGFSEINSLDISYTSLNEQRKTPWIDSFSLNQFLKNENTTIENLPAPARMLVCATK